MGPLTRFKTGGPHPGIITSCISVTLLPAVIDLFALLSKVAMRGDVQILQSCATSHNLTGSLNSHRYFELMVSY